MDTVIKCAKILLSILSLEIICMTFSTAVYMMTSINLSSSGIIVPILYNHDNTQQWKGPSMVNCASVTQCCHRTWSITV